MPIEAVVARTVQILLALAGAYLVALWFVLAVWAYRDIESRSRNILTQTFSTLLVVLFWVPGVLLYLILRPKETLDGAYQRSLEEEYLLQDLEELPLCPSCERYVEDDFVLCPHCHTRLREACLSCTRSIDLRWSICPYCGAAQGGETAGKPDRAAEPAARWRSPVRLRRVAAETPAVRAEAAEEPATAAQTGMPDESGAEEAVGAASAPAARAEPTEVAAEAEAGAVTRGGDAKEPIPLMPIPRGRFGRAGGERPAANGDNGRSGQEEEMVSASGPFTSILGTRNQENGRLGGSSRGRRATRSLDRMPSSNGTSTGDRTDAASNRPERQVSTIVPTIDDGAETSDREPDAEVVAARADGKGD